MNRLGGIAALLSVLAGVIGVWFFVKEHSFARQHHNELAAQLQWLGVALVLLAAAGFLIGIVIGYRDDE